MVSRSEKTSGSMNGTAAAAALAAVSISLLMAPAASANILLYPFSLCTNSHLFNFEKLAALLAGSGHQVTMLVSDKYRSPPAGSTKNPVHLLVYNTTEATAPVCEFETLDEFLDTPIMHIIQSFFASTYTACNSLLENTALLHHLKQERYDLVIYEALEQCSKILADYIDVPFVVFHTSGVDNIYPRHPGYLPSLLTTYCDQMTLHQRVLNTLGYILEKGIQYRNYLHYQQLKLEHGLNNTLFVSESFNRASLRFVLGDFGLDYVRPMQPSHVLLGGYVQASTPTTVSRQLQEYLDDSGPDGVVVLSFGQMVRQYGPKWRHLFANALARLPYKVLWKYNETRPVNLGSNTLTVPWFSQVDVLRHPNVRAFVTHCGLNSAFEASYSGIPVVAIPLFADQFHQATKLTQHAKMGIQLDIRTLTSDALQQTIIQVASNPDYRANAQQVSHILHKKPLSQQETILYWVDYIVHTKGAGHLRSSETDLMWYQYLLIDVLFILFLPCGLMLMTLGLGVRLLLVRLCQCRHSKVGSRVKGMVLRVAVIGGDLIPGCKEGVLIVTYELVDRVKLRTKLAH